MKYKRTLLTKTCLWTLNNFMFYGRASIVKLLLDHGLPKALKIVSECQRSHFKVNGSSVVLKCKSQEQLDILYELYWQYYYLTLDSEENSLKLLG